MESKLEEVLQENLELKRQLAESLSQLEEIRAELTDTQRQYVGTKSYIEDLRSQLDDKCKQLEKYANISSTVVVEAAVQVDIVPGEYRTPES